MDAPVALQVLGKAMTQILTHTQRAAGSWRAVTLPVVIAELRW
jgi:hypothetical protein